MVYCKLIADGSLRPFSKVKTFYFLHNSLIFLYKNGEAAPLLGGGIQPQNLLHGVTTFAYFRMFSLVAGASSFTLIGGRRDFRFCGFDQFFSGHPK